MTATTTTKTSTGKGKQKKGGDPWDKAFDIAARLKAEFKADDKAKRAELERAKTWGDDLTELRKHYETAKAIKDAPEDFRRFQWGSWCEYYTGRAYRSCRLYVQISSEWEQVQNCKSVRDAQKTLNGGKKKGDDGKGDQEGDTEGTKVKRGPTIPKLTNDERQRLTVALSNAGIRAIPDAVITAIVAAGFRLTRTKDADTPPTILHPVAAAIQTQLDERRAKTSTPATTEAESTEVDADGNLVE